MGDMQGPEVEFLQDALKRARQAAQERPVASQLSECRSFIERSERRFDARAAETVQLKEARNRLTCFEAQAAVLPADVPRHTPAADVSRIGRIEGEVGFHRTGTRRGIVCTSVQAASEVTNRSGSLWHPTSDSRFVRACRFVLVDGRSSCGAFRSHLDWGPGPHPEAHVHDGRVRRTVESVDRVRAIFRTVNSRYGLRGVRVGEASHPGPASKRRRTHRLRALQWSWDNDDESSTDNIHRRRVVLVPASPHRTPHHLRW